MPLVTGNSVDPLFLSNPGYLGPSADAFLICWRLCQRSRELEKQGIHGEAGLLNTPVRGENIFSTRAMREAMRVRVQHAMCFCFAGVGLVCFQNTVHGCLMLFTGFRT